MAGAKIEQATNCKCGSVVIPVGGWGKFKIIAEGKFGTGENLQTGKLKTTQELGMVRIIGARKESPIKIARLWNEAWGRAAKQAKAGLKLRMRGRLGGRDFSFRVADTPDAWSRGLQFQSALLPQEGMAFIYDEPCFTQFAMKSVSFPLDILFCEQERRGVYRIAKVYENCQPGSRKVFEYSPTDLVVEVTGGSGIKVGATVELDHSTRKVGFWPFGDEEAEKVYSPEQWREHRADCPSIEFTEAEIAEAAKDIAVEFDKLEGRDNMDLADKFISACRSAWSRIDQLGLSSWEFNAIIRALCDMGYKMEVLLA